MTAYNFYGTESPKQRSLKNLNMTQNNQKKVISVNEIS